MRFLSGRPALLSFGVITAAYVVVTVCAGVVTTHAVWRVSTAVLERLAPAATARQTPATLPEMILAAAGSRSVLREAAMTPLADRWDGRWNSEDDRPQPRMRGAVAGPQLGTPGRNPYQSYQRPFGRDDDDDNDDRPQASGTYRTVCVRLCDGYYFPLNFAVTPERLGRDRDVCESRCGAQGRLFVHPSGGSPDDMVDLQGRPYRQLRTAFLYRTEFVPSCKCQPDPWESASLDRHRAYALAAEAKKGNKDASKELQALQVKLKEAAKVAARSPPIPSAVPAANAGDSQNPAAAAAAAARQAEIAGREDGPLMGLGSDAAPKAKAERNPEPLRVNRDRDWIKRAFEPAGG